MNDVVIGSARIDEFGHARGGKSGDQSGKEVSTQNWYKHSKGWRVFRCIDSHKAMLIANDMVYACHNDKIGYDQNQRDTLYSESKEVGFNCSRVFTPCECDCSSLVRVCCAYAGIMLPNFNTTTEATVLLNSKMFVEMKGSKYTNSPNYLQRGDILVTKTQGHTVIVLDNGKYADKDSEDKTVTITSGKTVNIRTAPDISAKIVGIGCIGDSFPYAGEYTARWWAIDYHSEKCWISRIYTTLT